MAYSHATQPYPLKSSSSSQVFLTSDHRRRTEPAEMISSKSKRQEENYIGKQQLVQDLLSLMRIRDFIRLILSYPMSLGYEKFLKQWIDEVSQFSASYCLKMQQPDDDRLLLAFEDLWRWAQRLLSKKPLRYMEGIISVDMTRDIRNGGSIIFNEGKSEELTAATSTTSIETPLKQVPEPILHLATRLAVDQLTQILTPENVHFYQSSSHKIQNVWFSTLNDAEKHTVVGAMTANSQIAETFHRVRIIDVNQIDEKFEVLDLAAWLDQITSAELKIKDDLVLLAGENERRKDLTLVVDGDVDKKLDPWKVCFPDKTYSEGVFVFITTELSTSQNDELTTKLDLRIRTEDHLLPWEVFCKNVGGELVRSSCAIQKIAVQLVEECGGHLLAIVLVAKSLKNVEDIQTWKLTSEKLRYPNPSYKLGQLNRVGEVIMNAFMNIIWADVISERVKPRLTRCLRAFKLQDFMMTRSELFVRWFFEQLIESKEEAEHILRELVEPSILLQFGGTPGQYILLPEELKIILDVLVDKKSDDNCEVGALGLTQPPKVWDSLEATEFLTNFCTRDLNLSYSGIQSLPSFVFKLAQLRTLSLRGCKKLKQLPPEIAQLHNIEKLDLDGIPITYLPSSLNFPNLRSLSLGNNLDLMEIPPSFFHCMPLLNTLDLSRTSIHDLPSSFFNLQELREFYLKDCELFTELSPEIGRLRNLMTLDLDGTQITHLPNQIQELTNLESLSLSFSGFHHSSDHGKKYMSSSSFAMIPLGFPSKLTHLKVLRIDVNSDNEWWHKNVEHFLEAIVGLDRLIALDIYVPEVKFLKHIPWRVCFCSRLIVGHRMKRIISRVPPAVEVKFKESSSSLRFAYGMDVPHEVKSILEFASAFFLDSHMTINSLSEFGWWNLEQMRMCILAECNEMQSIMDEEDSYLGKLLYLEFLSISYMKNLRSIIKEPIRSTYCFISLRFLALHTCLELTTIFTMHFLHNLSQLEELIVEDCPKVRSIITCQSSERTADNFLPRLRKLSLLYVPELLSISNGVRIGRNLEEMGFYYCPKLESLSTAELSSQKLKVIRGELEWWKALKWSEAEWGQEGRPHEFNHIFSPIDEDLDILTQLTTYEVPSFNEENYSELPDWDLEA